MWAGVGSAQGPCMWAGVGSAQGPCMWAGVGSAQGPVLWMGECIDLSCGAYQNSNAGLYAEILQREGEITQPVCQLSGKSAMNMIK